jgi:hypothetical protein
MSNTGTKVQKNVQKSKDLHVNFLVENAYLLNESEFEKNLQGNIEIKKIPSDVFESLPDLIKTGCDTLTDSLDKEVFLYGAIGCISSILPNVEGLYDGKIYAPPLYIYVLGEAGAGKGALSYAKLLVTPIHNHRIEQNQDSDGESNTQRKMLFLPANSSSAGAIELLEGNDGKGLIFETEGDTLANVFKSDFGNYSDSFRKAFGHETISYYRKTDKKLVCVEKPYLATVISSTFGQLLNLIPNAENGLFSRFLYYELSTSDEFKNVFDRQKRGYNSIFEGLGEQVKKMYFYLETVERVEFTLQQHQEDFFMMIFRKWKRELRQFVNADLDGTIHRLGLICFRLSMIFTVLRTYQNNSIDTLIKCDDIDFINAVKIVEIAKNNAFAVFERLPKPMHIHSKTGEKLAERIHLLDQAKRMKDEGQSYSEISKALLGTEDKKGTIYKWLKAS